MAEQLSDDSSGGEMDQMEFSPDDNPEEKEMFNQGSNKQDKLKKNMPEEQDEQIQNQHFDEAMELSSNENSVVTDEDEKESEINPINTDLDQIPGGVQGDINRQNNDDVNEQETSPITGQQNPSDQENINVSREIQELFQQIQRYKAHQVDLETKLRPFIPDYMPAVGEVDAQIKPDRPDEKEETLGLDILDEPCLNQTDPTVLELKLRQTLKQQSTQPVIVRSIETAHQNPKQITRWINSVNDLHKNKPPATVQYSKQMPDSDLIMQVWPSEMEEAFNKIPMPSPDIELDLSTQCKVLLAILDIPVHENNQQKKSVVESLHLMFSVLLDFQENMHFQNKKEGGDVERFNYPPNPSPECVD